jgi:hypothetical protein
MLQLESGLTWNQNRRRWGHLRSEMMRRLHHLHRARPAIALHDDPSRRCLLGLLWLNGFRSLGCRLGDRKDFSALTLLLTSSLRKRRVYWCQSSQHAIVQVDAVVVNGSSVLSQVV